MTDPRREALAALRFNWSETPDHIWSTSPYHVDGLHERIEQAVRNSVNDANWSDGPSPIGLVLQGQKGVGKTHLLGWVRREVQRQKGYFFLVALNSGDTFWRDAADSVQAGLMQTDDSGESQLALLLRRLCVRIGTSDGVASAIAGDTTLTGDDLQMFMSGLRRIDPQISRECGDTARALVLYASTSPLNNNIGQDYLNGRDDPEGHGRQTWSIRPGAKPAHKVVKEVSRLLALTGSSVMAVDQLDTLVAKATREVDDPERDTEIGREMALIADGLMLLRERTRRTLSLVACLPASWQKLRNKAVDSVNDRFEEPLTVGRIISAERGRAFVEAWLTVPYEKIGFHPPYPTWPVAPEAFDTWDEHSAREVLVRIRAHAETCLRGEIRELTSFDLAQQPKGTTLGPNTGPEPDYFAEFDRTFAKLRADEPVHQAVDERTEDDVMPGYLSAGLRSWITEIGNDDMAWEAESQQNGTTVHAGLHRVVDENLDIEEHWAFRAIAATHHLSALHRLRNARAAAGGRSGSAGRHLILIRNIKWSKGAKTRAELDEFEQAGGRVIGIEDEDLRTFGALEKMLGSQSYELLEWLVARKPASRSALLREILPTMAPKRTPKEPVPTPTQEPVSETAFALGVATNDAAPVRIDLESLRKHVVIFAGSGSGKTVLMRRIVEECALRGVSAIVLDPNNDLARLGDAWPSPPEQWGVDDPGAASEYLANTDVVVWTPGRASGRPLSFQPLPDFAGVLDDEDEFNASVEAAVATLAPHAKVNGNTQKASRSKAVLREALTHYASTGARSLPGFIGMLADLPDGVSQLGNSQALAADLAETLKAAMVNNPLLGGMGEPADPAVLFTPSAGKRARVSVISFVGLSSDEQRQGFVNQLQMEVFAWIKRNPAGDRPLGGLLVMDEAQTLAPSTVATASTYSTIVLASQARKYGLGLLFATQAPKGLHNQITGNATTQFFGRLNSPAQIAAANDMARAKGSTVQDISQLERGQFYVTGEAFGFRRIQSPLCLSHHPPSPLRLEDVLERARNGSGPPG